MIRTVGLGKVRSRIGIGLRIDEKVCLIASASHRIHMFLRPALENRFRLASFNVSFETPIEIIVCLAKPDGGCDA